MNIFRWWLNYLLQYKAVLIARTTCMFLLLGLNDLYLLKSTLWSFNEEKSFFIVSILWWKRVKKKEKKKKWSMVHKTLIARWVFFSHLETPQQNIKITEMELRKDWKKHKRTIITAQVFLLSSISKIVVKYWLFYPRIYFLYPQRVYSKRVFNPRSYLPKSLMSKIMFIAVILAVCACVRKLLMEKVRQKLWKYKAKKNDKFLLLFCSHVRI